MAATATTTAPSTLLRITDLTATQLAALLDLADEIKNGPTWWTAARDGTAVACLFDESSALARASFEVAVHRLGMLPMLLRPEELRLDRGQPLADTARMPSSYADAIVWEQAASRLPAAQATLRTLIGSHHQEQDS
jgi:ornithine carbamoyltransferase